MLHALGLATHMPRAQTGTPPHLSLGCGTAIADGFILQQIAAIRGAVNGLMREVIKGHLLEHVVLEDDKVQREEDMEVVLKVLDSYIK